MLFNSRRCLRSYIAALETAGIRSPAEDLWRAEASLLQVQPPLCFVMRCFAEQFLFCAQKYMKQQVCVQGSGPGQTWDECCCLPGGNCVFVCRRRRNFYLSVAKGLVVLESVTAASATGGMQKAAIYWSWKSLFFTSKKNLKMKKKIWKKKNWSSLFLPRTSALNLGLGSFWKRLFWLRVLFCSLNGGGWTIGRLCRNNSRFFVFFF